MEPRRRGGAEISQSKQNDSELTISIHPPLVRYCDGSIQTLRFLRATAPLRFHCSFRYESG